MKKIPRSPELRSAIRAIEKAGLAGFEIGDIVEVIRQREKARETRKREIEDVYLDVVLERMHRREREEQRRGEEMNAMAASTLRRHP